MTRMGEKENEEFYREFAACVSESEIDTQRLLALLSTPQGREEFGEAAVLVIAGDLEAAEVATRHGYQSATGRRREALFSLAVALNLLPSSEAGKVNLSKIEPRLLHDRARLFFHLNKVWPGKFSLQVLAGAEVEANCASELSATLFGERGPNLISDLLHGPEASQVVALDLLDRAHAASKTCYDACYPDLVSAHTRCNNDALRYRIDAIAKRIRVQNPAALLPEALAAIVGAIRAGEDPAEALSAQRRVLNLQDSHISSLALAVADTLVELEEYDAAIGVIAAASGTIAAHSKESAWIALLLGDNRNAALALFKYGLEVNSHPFFDKIERYHAIELGCRLLFETRTASDRENLWGQAQSYSAAGLSEDAERISHWVAAFDGFPNYLDALISKPGLPKEDPDELRMSQRAIAQWHFLHALRENDSSQLNVGIEWFERSAIGNDAPWIEGERLLLGVAASASDIFTASPQVRPSRIREVESTLLRAAELIRSQYPVAISFALRGLSRRLEGDPKSIQDLNIAVRMLKPSTPEIARLRELVAAARWDASLEFTKRGTPAVAPAATWTEILKTLPLIASVADEDTRIKQHFAPYRGLASYWARHDQLEIVRSLRDPHQRGKALEEIIVKMVESSPGLRVLETRHRNSYEEIDIIVACTKDDPLISYWGPVFIIECKNWNQKVGTDPVRAFYTKMTTKKGAVRLGVIIASAGFTKGVDEATRVFQDGLVVPLSLDDLQPVVEGRSSFGALLRSATPAALFS